MATGTNGHGSGDGPRDPVEDALYGALSRVPPGPVQDALFTLFGFSRGLRERVAELEETVAVLQEEKTSTVEQGGHDAAS